MVDKNKDIDETCPLINGTYADEIFDEMMCVIHDTDIVSSCEGDSGGSFTVKEQGQHYLYGITSWGYGCAEVYPLYNALEVFQLCSFI